MRKSFFISVLAGALVLAVALPVLAEDANPLDVLKSDASFKDKEEACRALARTGGVEAVPVLAGMLTDATLAHIARGVLEPMPLPEAGAALRDALTKTEGNLKAGAISSLGMRKDTECVPALVAALADKDGEVIRNAALALGMIATPEAVAGLKDAAAKPETLQGHLNVVCNALMSCAEKLDAAQAAALFDLVRGTADTSAAVHAAALRGAILARGNEAGLPMLLDALRGEDKADFNAALRVARELPGICDGVAGVLAGLAPERKIALLDAMGHCGGDVAGAAALAEAKDGPEEVRIAALRSLTRMAYVPALDLIRELVLTDAGELGKEARNALSFFPGDAGDAMLKAMLGDAQPETRRIAVEMIGKGGLERPAALLMETATKDADEGVRAKALTVLRDCAGLDQMPGLIEVLLNATSDAERDAAKAVLTALCERSKTNAADAVVIVKATYGAVTGRPEKDVTEKVAELVNAGARTINAANNVFGEPAPGKVKKLYIEYTVNGAPFSAMAKENETLKLTVATAPAAVVDAFLAALDKAQGPAKLALVGLVGATGGAKALEAINGLAASDDTALKDAATHALCAWPTPEALPAMMTLIKAAQDDALKSEAMRGAMRMLGQNSTGAAGLFEQYAELLANATSADQKKLVLSGLAQVSHVEAFGLAAGLIADESVKEEALQAAAAIAKRLGKSAAEDASILNLDSWKGTPDLWHTEDGALAGGNGQPIAANEFSWADVTVGDFYLVMDVKLEPDTGNAGIQFRSSKVDDHGQALGYQADMGKGYWGFLYHEHGRGQLSGENPAADAVKPGEWNHYEILAVGPVIWTAINGTPAVAFVDKDPTAERSGMIAVQIHAGAPEKASYRPVKLVLNPEIKMEKMKTEALLKLLGK